MRYTRNHSTNNRCILQRQPRRKFGTHFFQLIIGHGFFPDNDVIDTQILVLGNGFALGSFANRKHGNHRCHTENNSQHGQKRPEFMIDQRTQRYPYIFFVLHSFLIGYKFTTYSHTGL
jgi:hypothetical protein